MQSRKWETWLSRAGERALEIGRLRKKQGRVQQEGLGLQEKMTKYEMYPLHYLP